MRRSSGSPTRRVLTPASSRSMADSARHSRGRTFSGTGARAGRTWAASGLGRGSAAREPLAACRGRSSSVGGASSRCDSSCAARRAGATRPRPRRRARLVPLDLDPGLAPGFQRAFQQLLQQPASVGAAITPKSLGRLDPRPRVGPPAVGTIEFCWHESHRRVLQGFADLRIRLLFLRRQNLLDVIRGPG